MNNRQIIDRKEQLVKDMTDVVSKSLIALGNKKCQLPWFLSSVRYENATLVSIKKVS